MLPFRKKTTQPIELKDVTGIEGSVYVRPWTLLEFKTIRPQLGALKVDEEGIDAIKKIICDRLVDSSGAPIPGADPANLDEFEAPTISDLFAQVCSRCGFAKREDLEKN